MANTLDPCSAAGAFRVAKFHHLPIGSPHIDEKVIRHQKNV